MKIGLMGTGFGMAHAGITTLTEHTGQDRRTVALPEAHAYEWAIDHA
ncbi:hypothetical protein AB0D04_07750 [Streptomyces sp. NPDC048483]